MAAELFPRSKQSEACLSGWRVSQLALGLLRPEERAPAEAHVATCAHCHQRVEDERAQQRAAAYEQVPAALLQAAEAAASRPSRWSWRRWVWAPAVAASLAVAGLAFLVIRPPVESGRPGEQLKGIASLDVAVSRSGMLVVNGTPAEKVIGLQAGDQLRLRAQGAPASAWLILQGDEENRWTTYFEGPVPEDGWLPMGLTITPEGRTRLRLLTCTSRPPAGAAPEAFCQERVHEWEVHGGR